MDKINELSKYSDFDLVKKIGKKYGINDIKISTRKDKKYMILDNNGKLIHFGQMGYEDYTKHRDLHRRKLFLQRNAKWADAEKYSPAFLSYYLLW
jgi:hypothetical protein